MLLYTHKKTDCMSRLRRAFVALRSKLHGHILAVCY